MGFDKKLRVLRKRPLVLTSMKARVIASITLLDGALPVLVLRYSGKKGMGCTLNTIRK